MLQVIPLHAGILLGIPPHGDLFGLASASDCASEVTSKISSVPGPLCVKAWWLLLPNLEQSRNTFRSAQYLRAPGVALETRIVLRDAGSSEIRYAKRPLEMQTKLDHRITAARYGLDLHALQESFTRRGSVQCHPDCERLIRLRASNNPLQHSKHHRSLARAQPRSLPCLADGS